jgi:hypothetical protein
MALINWYRPVNIQQIERKKNLFFMRGWYDGEKSTDFKKTNRVTKTAPYGR